MCIADCSGGKCTSTLIELLDDNHVRNRIRQAQVEKYVMLGLESEVQVDYYLRKKSSTSSRDVLGVSEVLYSTPELRVHILVLVPCNLLTLAEGSDSLAGTLHV